MSEQVEQNVEQKPEQTQTVSHADMFFHYVTALSQAAGVQAFTFAIAVPKPDGTSGIMARSFVLPEAAPAWKNEVARLLAANALKLATDMLTPEANGGGSIEMKPATDTKATEETAEASA